jgi:hypothetical protein
MSAAMKRVGAETESANRITLLRDTNYDGIAGPQTIRRDSELALRHDAFKRHTLCRQYRRHRRLPLLQWPDSDNGAAGKIVDLPAGPINHWTKTSSPAATEASSTSPSDPTAMSGKRHGGGRKPRRRSGGRSRNPPHAGLRLGIAKAERTFLESGVGGGASFPRRAETMPSAFSATRWRRRGDRDPHGRRQGLA